MTSQVSSADANDTISISDLTEYTEDSETSFLRPRSFDRADNDDFRRKYQKDNTELWSHIRERKDDEPFRDKHYHQWYYCKYCSTYNGITSATTFREYLRDKHRTVIAGTPVSAKRVTFNNLIKDLLSR